MTKQEWLQIGYEKLLIEDCLFKHFTFEESYKRWFRFKGKMIKAQSLDRIEVTYNRYFFGSDLDKKNVDAIREPDLIQFVSSVIASGRKITQKEFYRILQILRGVLVYMHDYVPDSGVGLIDWEYVKRSLPMDFVEAASKQEFAVPRRDIEKILDAVLNHNIYPEKRSACLCLCMNFFLGLRIGELASLTFDDFDFERNVVRIYKTECKYYPRADDGSKLGTICYKVVDNVKTVCSFREVPLMPEVKLIYEKIQEYHICRDFHSNYLAFDGADIVLVQSLATTLRKLCELCEVRYFNSHLIRKTFVTMLHCSGVPTRVIADIVGHSEIATTENNYILSYKDNQDVILNYMMSGLNITI